MWLMSCDFSYTREAKAIFPQQKRVGFYELTHDPYGSAKGDSSQHNVGPQEARS